MQALLTAKDKADMPVIVLDYVYMITYTNLGKTTLIHSAPSTSEKGAWDNFLYMRLHIEHKKNVVKRRYQKNGYKCEKVRIIMEDKNE